MRLYEFIDERSPDFVPAVERLKTEASDFLRDMITSQEFLYRGLSTYTPPADIIVDKSPTMRPPAGMVRAQQEALDKLFKMDNFTSLRHNSISCTADYTEAYAWGMTNTFMVFPHNGYSFTWSNQIRDLGGSYELFKSIVDIFGSQNGKIDPKETVTPEQCQKFIDRWEFHNTDMIAALTSHNEITIHGTYTMIRSNYKNLTYKLLTKPK